MELRSSIRGQQTQIGRPSAGRAAKRTAPVGSDFSFSGRSSKKRKIQFNSKSFTPRVIAISNDLERQGVLQHLRKNYPGVPVISLLVLEEANLAPEGVQTALAGLAENRPEALA